MRHFEQVSPADKGDGDIIGEGLSTMASDGGDAVAFDSRAVFGDASGSGGLGLTTYLARRGAGGWATHSLTPMPQPSAVQTLFGATQVVGYAEDLRTALVWAYDLPAVADDTPLRENLYLDHTASGALRTISLTQQDPLQPGDFLNGEFDGYSADAKHVAFETPTRMLPEAASNGFPNLYKWDDGVLSLVGILPDGSLPPGGATVFPPNIRLTMSRDGSRLVFSAASPDGSTPSQLYLHVDGRRSVWVTQPERGDRDRTPPDGDPTPANGVIFEGMTPDGNNVFFSSEDPLVDEDTAPGPDLYRFTYSVDAESNGHNLTLLTNDGQAANDPASVGGSLVGMSDDARLVYIHSTGQGLKLWQEGVPGLLTVDANAARPTAQKEWLTLVGSMPGFGRVSPDGNWLAYMTGGQMYLYDRSRQSLTCVSCPSGASIEPTVTKVGRRYIKGFRPRFLTPDGKVFFSSTGSLVPEDTNGVADVYEYDGQTRTLSLLTTGKGREPMMFADASRSGNDVFVVTRQQLVKSDRDNYVDVYDVRVGPAPPEQPLDTAPACEGTACQGALSVPPAEASLGSSLDDAPAGPGDGRLAVRHRVTIRGSIGLLRVKLGAGGRIAWSGRGLVSGSLRRRSAGTVGLHLRLGTGARVRLKRFGHYATTVRLRFRAADGSKATAVVHVTFKSQQRKGR